MKHVKIKSILKDEISSKSKSNKLSINTYNYICLIILILIIVNYFFLIGKFKIITK